VEEEGPLNSNGFFLPWGGAGPGWCGLGLDKVVPLSSFSLSWSFLVVSGGDVTIHKFKRPWTDCPWSLPVPFSPSFAVVQKSFWAIMTKAKEQRRRLLLEAQRERAAGIIQRNYRGFRTRAVTPDMTAIRFPPEILSTDHDDRKDAAHPFVRCLSVASPLLARCLFGG
jgi:hypothetical protein